MASVDTPSLHTMQNIVSRLRTWPFAARGTPLAPVDAVWMLALATTFVVWVTQAFPWTHFHELSQDEGHHLAKAALLHAGFRMYTDIGSDQPPLLTYALSALQRVAPWDVQAARWLVLVSALLLLGSLYALIVRLHGRLVALWSVTLLMTAPLFMRLSVSVMLGLPSLALAVAALAVAVVPRWPVAVRMVLAGVLYALSLQTKLFTVLLAPAMLLGIVIGGTGVQGRSSGRAVLWFVGACLAGLTLIGLWAGEAFLSQLILPHVSPALRRGHSLAASASAIQEVLRAHAFMAVAAVPALLVGVLGGSRARPLWLPVLWLMVPLFGLLLHTPVRSHQVLLLLVPLAWLGGLAIAWLLGGLRALPVRWVGAGAWLAGAVLLGLVSTLAWQAQAPEPQAEAKRALLGHIGQAPVPGSWMVTDAPMDAFRTGYLVPPELAVYPTTGRKAGALKPDLVIQAIERWQPQQVSFRLLRPEPALAAYLNQRYLKVFEHQRFSQWLPYPVRATGAEEQAVRQRLDQLLDGFAATGINGAFAGVITQDGQSRYGEAVTEPIGADSAFMRPPGSTPRIGACYLQAHRVTGEPRHRDTARLVAGAVVRAQTCQGGWLSASALEPRCGVGEVREEPGITLDEGLTAQAIGFLMDLQAIEPDRPRRDRLQVSIARALDYLVDKQNGHGAWPLSFGRMSYASHSTINDDLTTSHVRILLRAQAAYSEPRYRKAALRGIEFLLRTQSSRGGWAQQYNERLEPAGARRHEPAALSSLETAFVLHTLLYARTVLDDPRLLPALNRGTRWLEKSAIGVNRWARFYDLKRNRPLYVDPYGALHRTLDALPAERRDSYRWEGGFSEVVSAIALARAAGQGDEALALARQRVSLVQRLEHQREARAWIAQHADEAQVVLADGKGLIWAKEVIQRCEQLLSLLR